MPRKLEMAKRFGATHGVTPDELEGAKQEITRGEGFDYALECVGHPQTIRATYDAIRRGGTAGDRGVGRMDQKIEFSAFELFYAEKTLKGSMYGSANVRDRLPALLRLWKQGKLDLEGMISPPHQARRRERGVPRDAGGRGDPLGDRLRVASRRSRRARQVSRSEPKASERPMDEAKPSEAQ
jgi:S-(hydroxymethyl)glutathione dehydrogenase/alcohol dehydrogenase